MQRHTVILDFFYNIMAAEKDYRGANGEYSFRLSER
jgi:hypothetical protein